MQAALRNRVAVPVLPATKWQFLPSATKEYNAKRLVQQCESFQEFVVESELDRHTAADIWEAYWGHYDMEENRATGN